jgi:hypothetical protein
MDTPGALMAVSLTYIGHSVHRFGEQDVYGEQSWIWNRGPEFTLLHALTVF